MIKKIAAIISLWLGRYAGVIEESNEEEFVEERGAYLGQVLLNHSDVPEATPHYNVTSMVDGPQISLPCNMDGVDYPIIGNRRPLNLSINWRS